MIIPFDLAPSVPAAPELAACPQEQGDAGFNAIYNEAAGKDASDEDAPEMAFATVQLALPLLRSRPCQVDAGDQGRVESGGMLAAFQNLDLSGLAMSPVDEVLPGAEVMPQNDAADTATAAAITAATGIHDHHSAHADSVDSTGAMPDIPVTPLTVQPEVEVPSQPQIAETKLAVATPAPTMASQIAALPIAAAEVRLFRNPQGAPAKGEGAVPVPRVSEGSAEADLLAAGTKTGHGQKPVSVGASSEPKPLAMTLVDASGDLLDDPLAAAGWSDVAADLPPPPATGQAGPAAPAGAAHAAPGTPGLSAGNLSAVAQALPMAAQTGDRVEVILSPEELGRVQIDFRHEHGGIRVVLMAERPETLDLFRRHGDQLIADLRQAGFDGASLSFGQWGGSQDDFSGQGGSGGGHGLTRDLPEIFTPLLPGAATRPGLDLRI